MKRRRWTRFAGWVFAVCAIAISLRFVLNSIGGSVEDVDGKTFLAFVAGCGLCSMILIETGKRLFPVRGWYVRRMTGAWLRQRAELWQSRGTIERPIPGSDDDDESMAAFGQLIEVMSLDVARHIAGPDKVHDDQAAYEAAQSELGGRWSSLIVWRPGSADPFNLPIEQFVGQVSAATDHAIQRPWRNLALLRLLTARLPFDEQERKLADMHYLAQSPDAQHGLDPGLTDSRVAIEQEVTFAMDSLQIWLATGWRYLIRASAALVAGGLGLIAVTSSVFEEIDSSVYAIGALLFGGWFAWFWRDLTAVVERLRR